MKKICKGMAVFAIVVGVVCLASCVSLGEIFGSMFGSQFVAGFITEDNSKEYVSLVLKANGDVEAARFDSSKVKGKWENSSGSTDSVKNGDVITITVEEKSVKGTVRQVKFERSDTGDYTLTEYSVNLGAWGPYTWKDEKYESVN